MANKPYEKYYPLVGFHFKVVFTGIGDADIDCRFQTVSGLNVELETETKKEGGENRFEHVLPVRTKYPLLVLKRGLIKESSLKDWMFESFDAITMQIKPENKSKPLIQPKNLTVSLLNKDGDPLITWKIVHAWPKKWSLSDFNAEQSALVIESLELQYQYYTISK